ncbi:MAG: hypothetical protein WKF40_04385 [Thermoleophilaceae bacterium]
MRELVHAADPEIAETINAGAFKAMIAQIAANNRAGGWRKLKREGWISSSATEQSRAGGP